MEPDPRRDLYLQLLILRCQIGSEAAFRELVERHSPALRRYLRTLLHNEADAADALQDVWTSVFRGLPRLKEARAFTTWLYRIARDRAYRDLRRHPPRVEHLVEADLPGAAAEEHDAAEYEQLRAALRHLGRHQRELLLLRFEEELSSEEIGRLIGCAAGTVRSRLHQAMQELRDAFRREPT